MMRFVLKAGFLAACFFCFAVAGRAQYDEPPPDFPIQQPSSEKPAPKVPVVNKQELAAYNKIVADRADAAKVTEEAEAFVVKYPQSKYNQGVYAQLTNLYFAAGQTDKMMQAGAKTLALNPDNVDVLPILAMATARGITAKTADVKGELQKAEDYGNHAVEILNALAKPDGLDDATFNRTKNDRIAMSRSALGLVNFDRGKYDDAVTQLTQAVQLASSPDPVDYFILGRADVSTNHFTGGIDAFTKCAASAGPLQAPCKAGIDDAKKKQATGLEAPQ
jgi:tetratricopeptide (TPR) repeat protein